MLAMVVKFLLGHLIFALMLGVGLAARARDFDDIRRRPALYAKALAVMWIGVPLLTMAVLAVIPLGRIPTELFLIVAVCPGAPFISTKTKQQHARYSVVGLNVLLLTSLSAPLLVPAWIAILDRGYPFGVEITAMQLLAKIIPDIIVPLFAGLTISVISPRLAQALARPVQYFFLAALAVAVVLVLYLGVPVFRHVAPQVYLAMLVIIAGSTLMGYLSATPRLEDRRTIGIAAAQGNPGLALAVIAASHPGFQAAAIVVAYILLRTVAMIPFHYWMKHHERAQGAKLRGHTPAAAT